jgi:hypothetical protein
MICLEDMAKVHIFAAEIMIDSHAETKQAKLNFKMNR